MSFAQLQAIVVYIHDSLKDNDLLHAKASVSWRTFAERLQEKDMQASQLLPADIDKSLIPVCVYGDGNCLPRALSMLTYGHEDAYIEMRARITVEMVTNEDNLLDDDHLARETVQKNLSKIYAGYSAEYTPWDLLTPAEIRRIYEQEAKQGAYMGIWQVHTLPNILGRPLYSVYPQYGAINDPYHLHKLMKPECGTGSDPAYVMWTHTQIFVWKSLGSKSFRPFIEYKSCRRRAKSYQHHTGACCHTREYHRARTCYHSWRSSPISRSSNHQQGQWPTQGTWTSAIYTDTPEKKTVALKKRGLKVKRIINLASNTTQRAPKHRTGKRNKDATTNGNDEWPCLICEVHSQIAGQKKSGSSVWNVSDGLTRSVHLVTPTLFASTAILMMICSLWKKLSHN